MFLICLIMTFIHFFMYIVAFDNQLSGYGIGLYLGTVMAIIGDSQWIGQIDQFAKVFARYPSAASSAATLLVYVSQFILKHLVFSFFFSVVVSSKPQ
jgi:hypothetical protein